MIRLTDRSCIRSEDLGRILFEIRYSLDTAASHRNWIVYRQSSGDMMAHLHNYDCAGVKHYFNCRVTVSYFRGRSMVTGVYTTPRLAWACSSWGCGLPFRSQGM